MTDTKCRNVKGAAKPFKLTDGGGLHLLVMPDGARYWRLAYRWLGKQRTLALGVYPTVSLTAARVARDAAKRDLTKSTDPSAARKERRQALRMAAENTFEAVAREWHSNQASGWTPEYAELVMRRLEADAFPAIGRRAVLEIEPPDVLDMLRKVERRGAIETARRLRQYVSMIFRFGIVTGRVKRDPSADLKGALKATGEPQHHKAMPRKDLSGFLKAVQTYDGDPRTRLALRLVVLTFLRTGELRAGRWSELEDLDGKEPLWRIPPSRMKKRREHLVPLSRQVVAVLRELRAFSGNSPFIFPSPGKEGTMSNNTMLYALYRMGFHGRATTHGFRSVASTILNESGFNRDWIERQLAHVEKDAVRAAYNAAEWLPDRRRMMQWFADYLDALALDSGGNVVVLSRAS